MKIESVFYTARALFGRDGGRIPVDSCGHKHRSFQAAYDCGVATFSKDRRLFDVFKRKRDATSQ